MKLAEALMLRAQYKQDIESLKRRINENVRVQEGDEPIEPPTNLVDKAVGINEHLAALVIHINATNASTRMDDGMLLSEALAKRDALLKERTIYKTIVEASGERRHLFSRDEIRKVLTVDVAEYQKKLDATSAAYREFDVRIQATNWATELLE
jgi:hypothetical protein